MTAGKRIFIAGDSTAASYSADRSPMAGWGQMLCIYLQKGVAVMNEAVAGRSSKSFIDEGRLKHIDESIRSGDCLLVQFGHNDQKSDAQRHTDAATTYPDCLTQFIEVARKHEAVPVLLTPVARRSFDANGELLPTHGDYPGAMRKLAAERHVPLVDMEALTAKLYRELGPEESKRLFVWLEPGEHPNYAAGLQDNTHFSECGAAEAARLAAAGLYEACPGLRPWLKTN